MYLKKTIYCLLFLTLTACVTSGENVTDTAKPQQKNKGYVLLHADPASITLLDEMTQDALNGCWFEKNIIPSYYSYNNEREFRTKERKGLLSTKTDTYVTYTLRSKTPDHNDVKLYLLGGKPFVFTELTGTDAKSEIAKNLEIEYRRAYGGGSFCS
jgi:hypothetical protein